MARLSSLRSLIVSQRCWCCWILNYYSDIESIDEQNIKRPFKDSSYAHWNIGKTLKIPERYHDENNKKKTISITSERWIVTATCKDFNI